MTTDELKAFISSKMSTSHIYQPVIILTLLENKGVASADKIAQKCVDLRGDTAHAYAQRLVKYPREALLKHGVLSSAGRNDFCLAVDLAAVSQPVLSDLIATCKTRLDKVR